MGLRQHAAYIPPGLAFSSSYSNKNNWEIQVFQMYSKRNYESNKKHLGAHSSCHIRERKFILGNAKGEVAVYNFRNGAKMKDLDTQAGPIAALVYCAREKAVLVACQVPTDS